MDITKLNEENKCIFAIKLAQKASSYLQESNVHSLINKAIEVALKWEYIGENIGEILYNFLDNEENGFTLFQEMEEDEKNINAWNCIIYSLAYVSRVAYEKDGVKYFPEPIEAVDDDVFIYMIQSLISCNSIERDYIENIYNECLEKN